MSNHGVIKWEKVRYHLFVYKESKSPAFTATVTSWLLIMTHMTHHRDQWVTSYKMNTMTSWLRHHFRSLPVWSWPEMIFMGFSERRIFYWLTSHKKFLDITYRFSKTIAKLLLALKKMDLIETKFWSLPKLFGCPSAQFSNERLSLTLLLKIPLTKLSKVNCSRSACFPVQGCPHRTSKKIILAKIVVKL